MHAPNHDDLLTALDEPSALAEQEDRAVLGDLRSRLLERRLRILVAGEAKRGKSTLINALLGRALLPVGVTPLTALATTVRYGADEAVTAVFGDGRSEAFPLSALGDLFTEGGNPGNCRGLASVTVAVDAPVLARGVELVDTPGTGSVYGHNTAEAETALETMDAAVFVLTADPPVSASERDLMARVAGLSVSMFVVLNKADYLDADAELAEALEFTARVAAEASGRRVRVHPMSARAALTGRGDAGFAAFAADFAAYLESGQAADLRLSVAGHASRLARSLLDEAYLTRRAAQMRSGGAAGRVQAFSARLDSLGARRRDAADQAGQTELLAGAIRRHLPGEAGRRRVREYLRREAADLVPQQIGRARADLQYRLAEATRRLSRQVEARYAESTGRLENALLAADMRNATAGDAAQQDHLIARRQEDLAAVLSRLDQAVVSRDACDAVREDARPRR